MIAYIRNLWQGALPLPRLLVTDMLLVGTLVNISGTALALLALAGDLPVALGVAIHFAPLPYNFLLLLAVWRAAKRSSSQFAWSAHLIAHLWFLAMLIA